MIDRDKPCTWFQWNGRTDAFETDCTGTANMPYFIGYVPVSCPRCQRATDLRADADAEIIGVSLQ